MCHKTNHIFIHVSPIELISSPLVQFLSALLWDIKHCDVCFDNGDGKMAHIAIIFMAILKSNMALFDILLNSTQKLNQW